MSSEENEGMVQLIGRLLQAAAAEQHAWFATDSLGFVSLEALRQALSEELGSEVTTDTLRRVVRRYAFSSTARR